MVGIISCDTYEVLGSILFNANYFIFVKSHGHVIYDLIWKVGFILYLFRYFGHVMYFLIGKVGSSQPYEFIYLE